MQGLTRWIATTDATQQAAIGMPFMGGGFLTAALIGVLAGFFARLTIASNVARDREEEARRTFRETGRWPQRGRRPLVAGRRGRWRGRKRRSG